MNRDRSISASDHSYRRRRAVAAILAAVLALCAAYSLFLITCGLMVVLGLAA